MVEVDRKQCQVGNAEAMALIKTTSTSSSQSVTYFCIHPSTSQTVPKKVRVEVEHKLRQVANVEITLLRKGIYATS